MPCGDSCFSLHLFSASSLTVSIPLPVFSVQVIASLPSLNPRRIFYGSTTREDDRGDEAAQLRIEDTEVLPGRDVGLAKHYRQFPDQLVQEQIRAYGLHLHDRGLSSSSQNVAVSGLKFFYQQVLGCNEKQLFLPPRKRLWRLPQVLSPREVEQLLICAVKLRDRCLLMTADSSGLRVGELVHLKLSDIDPERMMIRVEQGKGKKDRYTILSQRLLGELKKYKQTYQPVSWVFFGKNRHCPLDISAAQKVYNLAKQKSAVGFVS